MPITAQEALQRTIEHREIFHDEMLKLMRMIMNGELSPVMTAAIITGLRVKKETIGEITAAAQVMREFSTKVHVPDAKNLVDIVGTGGDGAHTFNISTAAMFVAAAAGAKILHLRAVEFARRHGVDLRVRSTFSDDPGTVVYSKGNPKGEGMEEAVVSGVATDKSQSKITVIGIPDQRCQKLVLTRVVESADCATWIADSRLLKNQLSH